MRKRGVLLILLLLLCPWAGHGVFGDESGRASPPSSVPSPSTRPEPDATIVLYLPAEEVARGDDFTIVVEVDNNSDAPLDLARGIGVRRVVLPKPGFAQAGEKSREKLPEQAFITILCAVPPDSPIAQPVGAEMPRDPDAWKIPAKGYRLFRIRLPSSAFLEGNCKLQATLTFNESVVARSNLRSVKCTLPTSG